VSAAFVLLSAGLILFVSIFNLFTRLLHLIGFGSRND
jgi:hypothetical protein